MNDTWLMPLHVLNHEGIAEFRHTLRKMKVQQTNDLPSALIESPAFTQIIDADIMVEQRNFPTTSDMVRYLHPIIQQVELADKFYNPGLWSWLSAFYFDVVCPIDRGVRNPGEEARHIPPLDRNWREYYRHLIAAPIRLYDTHGESLTKPFFYLQPHERSEFLREIMGVQELAMNPGILEAIRLLYWDAERERPKVGAFAKARTKPGTLRRFVGLMNQFNLTYDLQAMNGFQIVALLPKREFGHWLN